MDDLQLRWATAWVIKEARDAAGMTQSQLAGFAGFSGGTIPRAEQSNSDLTVIELVRIAAVLKTSPTELMRRY